MMTIEMPQWIMVVANFGFPIAITIYLSIRFEKKIEKLELVIDQLSETIRNIGKD